MTNNVFLGKKVKTQQQQKKINIKTLARAGNLTGNSRTQSGCVKSATPS